MANELITGWFTLGGAAVGAVATSVVTSITAWGQQRAASRARIAAREDVFRADAGAYVSAVDIYMGWAIDLHQKLLVPAGQRELDLTRQAYLDAWATLGKALGPVQVSAPESVGKKAIALWAAINNYGYVLDGWHSERSRVDEDDDDREPDAKRDAAFKLRHEFVALVVELLAFDPKS